MASTQVKYKMEYQVLYILSRFVPNFTLNFNVLCAALKVVVMCQCVNLVFQTGAVHVDTYKDSDLSIGAQLNIWGRKVVLCDCDDFTKEFFRTKYGISEL